jgi:DNA polymerase III alpha subunit
MTETNVLVERFSRAIPDSPDYQDRLIEELKIIESFRFETYFLQILDILDLVKDIPHITRGSAGSSLVCYLLGITDIDPVAEGISHTRFINQYRTDDPDIDIDFPHFHHEEVHNRIYKRWPDRAYRISNVIHFRKKSAVNEAKRRIVGTRKDISDEETIAIEEMAHQLHGKERSISKHCGGVVILDSKAPADWLVNEKQINKDKRQVEKLGLRKIDILSNRGLSQLVDCSDVRILDYPEYDELTSKMLSSGDSIGVTQAESPAFRKMLRALKPRSRSDIILAMGLIRPAAASRGRKHDFLEAWRENGEITNLIFEDDATKKIAELANIPLDEADKYRRAFAKGNKEKITEFLKKVEIDQQTMNDLEQFREYSLCKAHGISYGRMVWALAYEKANNPKKFWWSTIKNCHSMYRKWVHIQEAKRAGWNIRAGNLEPRIVGDTIWFGVQQTELLPMNGHEEMEKYGFWSSNRFYPGTGIKDHPTVPYLTIVRGLIATYRVIKDEDGWSFTNFVTVGYEDGKFLDIVIKGPTRYKWKEKNILHVCGVMKSLHDSKWLSVDQVIEVS